MKPTKVTFSDLEISNDGNDVKAVKTWLLQLKQVSKTSYNDTINKINQRYEHVCKKSMVQSAPKRESAIAVAHVLKEMPFDEIWAKFYFRGKSRTSQRETMIRCIRRDLASLRTKQKLDNQDQQRIDRLYRRNLVRREKRSKEAQEYMNGFKRQHAYVEACGIIESFLCSYWPVVKEKNISDVIMSVILKLENEPK